MSPEDVVRKFCQAVARADVRELAAFFTEDAVYHNIPLAPVSGRAAIEATLAQFIAPGARVEFELKGLATRDALVLTERVDRFEMMGKSVALPVAGVFQVRNGKIAAWRDYFDMQTWMTQTGMS